MMKIEDGGFSGLRQLNKQLQELASALQARFKPSSSREGQQATLIYQELLPLLVSKAAACKYPSTQAFIHDCEQIMAGALAASAQRGGAGACMESVAQAQALMEACKHEIRARRAELEAAEKAAQADQASQQQQQQAAGGVRAEEGGSDSEPVAMQEDESGDSSGGTGSSGKHASGSPHLPPLASTLASTHLASAATKQAQAAATAAAAAAAAAKLATACKVEPCEGEAGCQAMQTDPPEQACAVPALNDTKTPAGECKEEAGAGAQLAPGPVAAPRPSALPLPIPGRPQPLSVPSPKGVALGHSPGGKRTSSAGLSPLSNLEALVAACELAAEQEGLDSHEETHYFEEVVAESPGGPPSSSGRLPNQSPHQRNAPSSGPALGSHQLQLGGRFGGPPSLPSPPRPIKVVPHARPHSLHGGGYGGAAHAPHVFSAGAGLGNTIDLRRASLEGVAAAAAAAAGNGGAGGSGTGGVAYAGHASSRPSLDEGATGGIYSTSPSLYGTSPAKSGAGGTAGAHGHGHTHGHGHHAAAHHSHGGHGQAGSPGCGSPGSLAAAAAAAAANECPKYRRHKSKVFIRPNKVVYLPTTFMEDHFDPAELPLNCEMVVEADGHMVQGEKHLVTIKAVPRQGLSTMFCMTNVMKFQQQYLNWQILNWTKIDSTHIKIHLQSPEAAAAGGCPNGGYGCGTDSPRADAAEAAGHGDAFGNHGAGSDVAHGSGRLARAGAGRMQHAASAGAGSGRVRRSSEWGPHGVRDGEAEGELEAWAEGETSRDHGTPRSGGGAGGPRKAPTPHAPSPTMHYPSAPGLAPQPSAGPAAAAAAAAAAQQQAALQMLRAVSAANASQPGMASSPMHTHPAAAAAAAAAAMAAAAAAAAATTGGGAGNSPGSPAIPHGRSAPTTCLKRRTDSSPLPGQDPSCPIGPLGSDPAHGHGAGHAPMQTIMRVERRHLTDPQLFAQAHGQALGQGHSGRPYHHYTAHAHTALPNVAAAQQQAAAALQMLHPMLTGSPHTGLFFVMQTPPAAAAQQQQAQSPGQQQAAQQGQGQGMQAQGQAPKQPEPGQAPALGVAISGEGAVRGGPRCIMTPPDSPANNLMSWNTSLLAAHLQQQQQLRNMVAAATAAQGGLAQGVPVAAKDASMGNASGSPNAPPAAGSPALAAAVAVTAAAPVSQAAGASALAGSAEASVPARPSSAPVTPLPPLVTPTPIAAAVAAAAAAAAGTQQQQSSYLGGTGSAGNSGNTFGHGPSGSGGSGGTTSTGMGGGGNMGAGTSSSPPCGGGGGHGGGAGGCGLRSGLLDPDSSCGGYAAQGTGSCWPAGTTAELMEGVEGALTSTGGAGDTGAPTGDAERCTGATTTPVERQLQPQLQQEQHQNDQARQGSSPGCSAFKRFKSSGQTQSIHGLQGSPAQAHPAHASAQGGGSAPGANNNSSSGGGGVGGSGGSSAAPSLTEVLQQLQQLQNASHQQTVPLHGAEGSHAALLALLAGASYGAQLQNMSNGSTAAPQMSPQQQQVSALATLYKHLAAVAQEAAAQYTAAHPNTY